MQAPIFSSNIPLYQLHELVRQCIDVRNINETVTIDSHQQKSPGGANRRLPPP